MADENAKKYLDIEDPEPNKTETKRSEPNWNIYILILNFLFSPFDYWFLNFYFGILFFDFWLSTFVFWLLSFEF